MEYINGLEGTDQINLPMNIRMETETEYRWSWLVIMSQVEKLYIALNQISITRRNNEIHLKSKLNSETH